MFQFMFILTMVETIPNLRTALLNELQTTKAADCFSFPGFIRFFSSTTKILPNKVKKNETVN